MRRILTVTVTAALLLSIGGSAFAIEPVTSSPPAASVEPSPAVSPAPDPSASVDPAATTGPAGSAPAGSAPAGSAPAATADPGVPSPAAPSPPSQGKPIETAPVTASGADPTGRWIVVLKAGTNATLAGRGQGRRLGFTPDRTFGHAIRGYAAKMDRAQVDALRRDPTVALIVPDERIQAEVQTIPTGISRMGARVSPMARIDGVDQRVDADVAIVDTGIARVPDLNVAGGYNCSTADRTAWRDVYGHGTHVAGTVGAIDNADGVVGVAPGVRLWAVKILDDTGAGLLSWYVCGLDWIAAQKDPNDATRPLIEAVNMSVAKYGSDDGNCGLSNSDVLHQAICRLVSSGVTVVAAAGNDSSSAAARVPAAYNEVITVSALADTDGKPGGLGGNRCYSWGSYDKDDTFADFSNYGSDVDLIAPGKCIWSTVPGGYKYMSGTSMATPHVTGAVALLKATRPMLSPREVKEALQYLGNLNWNTATDPDTRHEKLLDVSRIGPRGDFTIGAGGPITLGEIGGTARIPITIARGPTLFERITLGVSGLPAGVTASFDTASLFGFEGVRAVLTVTVPHGTLPGSYPIVVSANEHGRVHTASATVVLTSDNPTARPPTLIARPLGGVGGATTVPTRAVWSAATDPSSAIGGYEFETSVDGGAFGPATATSAAVRTVDGTQTVGHAYQYRVRARDSVGNWSPWVAGPTVTSSLVQESSSAVAYRGTWTRLVYRYASGGTVRYARAAGASARTTFIGRAVGIVAPVGPSRGTARIYVDGVYRATVSFRASVARSRVVMYSLSFPSPRTHRIELRLIGTGRVDLDAFIVVR